MARGRKTGGRQKGARNRATAEARADAEATGILPLDYMLSVMRDVHAEPKRRDAMAIAAAQYVHPKFSPIEPRPNEREIMAVNVGERGNGSGDAENCGIRVEFVRPSRQHDDE